MAIDTEEKRRATLGVWGIVRVLPVPDVGIDVAEREYVWLYGVEAGSGPGPGGVGMELISTCEFLTDTITVERS